jgi:plastocyanin
MNRLSSVCKKFSFKAVATGVLATGLCFSGVVQKQAAVGADWADLQLTFIYDEAEIPKLEPVDMGKDPACVGLWKDGKPMSEDLLVDPVTKGIKNIVVYPDPKKSGIEVSDAHPDLQKAPESSVVLDNVKCVFVPHVFAARPGQTVNVKNSDPMGHNALFNVFANEGVNPLIPAGGSKDVTFDKAERAPIPVQCNIHPWMISYMLIFDQPYAGISDATGVLKIEKLPAGKPITFKVWHEKMDKSIDSVTLDGKPVEWKKGLVEFTLKPGMNNLGVVKIKKTEFK